MGKAKWSGSGRYRRLGDPSVTAWATATQRPGGWWLWESYGDEHSNKPCALGEERSEAEAKAAAEAAIRAHARRLLELAGEEP